MTAVNLNRAIRGPVTAVPIVAGTGVRLVADTQNNRWLVEADETVLYDSNSDDPSQILATTALNLTESYLNFEKIRIYLLCSAGDVSHVSYTVEGIVRSSTITELSTLPITTSTGVLQYDPCTFAFASSTPTVCTVRPYGSRIAVSNSGAFSKVASRGPAILKIVGINRISA